MAIAQFTAIASITLTSAQQTISFGNIPSDYRDLRLVMNSINTTGATATDGYLRINGDTGANYNSVKMYGSGSSYSSVSRASANELYYDIWSTSQPTLLTIDILDYSQTNKHKAMLIRGSDSNSGVHAIAARWASLSALNLITIYSTDQAGAGSPDSFAAGSTFTLYGVK